MATYDDLVTATQLMGALFLGLGVVLALLPVAECPSCKHCAERRVASSPICPLHRIPRDRCDSQHKET